MTIDIADLRARHANAIRNTATGKALEQALQEIERLRAALSAADESARLQASVDGEKIERLRAALLCEDCNGTGWIYCGVADTSTPCRNCAAYDIRKA